MSLAYVGVKGEMVVVCADDPGPISSQTEQDPRRRPSEYSIIEETDGAEDESVPTSIL